MRKRRNATIASSPWRVLASSWLRAPSLSLADHHVVFRSVMPFLLLLLRWSRVVPQTQVPISVPEFYLLVTGLFSAIKAILFGMLLLLVCPGVKCQSIRKAPCDLNPRLRRVLGLGFRVQQLRIEQFLVELNSGNRPTHPRFPYH